MKCSVNKRWAIFLLTMLLAGLTTQPSLSQTSNRTLIRNANLLVTMEPRLGDGEFGLIANGDVFIEGDRISAVGKGLDGSGARIRELLMPRARSCYPGLSTCTTTCGNRSFGAVGRLWPWAIG